MTAAILGVLALLLAGPVPALLARARWTRHVPRASIVLWQALALAAVLAALGAGLALGMEALLSPRYGIGEVVLHSLITALTCVIAARLAWSAVKVAVRTRARRRRHRELVDLVASPDVQDPELRVLAEQTPFAYCVPGLRDARVVLSSGALEKLSTHELVAVLAHERAHLRARHDLVLEAFTALREAFPGFARGRTPLEHSSLLVEMLADDAARRRVGAVPLARALVTLAGAPAGCGGLAASGTGTLARLHRLREPAESHHLLAALTYLAAATVLVLPTVTVAIPWLVSMSRSF
ncbi:M56 family metallopeptidase [Flindersiella endophytica]